MNTPSKAEALEAIKVLLKFIGENPEREGLKNTPERVVNYYIEMLKGYDIDVSDALGAKFYDIGNVQDFVLLRDISFSSLCEHHLLPIMGKADIAYVPNDCIIGISKLARIVDIFSKRLQVQEKLTIQIAETLHQHLNPLGVAVKISASHCCMTIRGVMKEHSFMDTTHYTGVFKSKDQYRQDFLNIVYRS